jgi:hypothetical protein
MTAVRRYRAASALGLPIASGTVVVLRTAWGRIDDAMMRRAGSMGHQVNFYATPVDIAALGAAVSRVEPMLILHDRSSSAEPRSLPALDHHEGGRRHLFYFLVREADLAHVVTTHVPAQARWTVDVLRSPVIEFTSCFFDGNLLRRGRVYYVDGFYGEDGAWLEKPESFRTWAKRVLHVTRTALTKFDEREYIGADARAWLEHEHGRLVSG